MVHALQTEEMFAECLQTWVFQVIPLLRRCLLYPIRKMGRYRGITRSGMLTASSLDPFPLTNLGSLTETNLTHREKSVLRLTFLRLS